MTARGLLHNLYSGTLRSDQIVWRDPQTGHYHVGPFDDEGPSATHQWIGTVYFLRLQDQSLALKSPGYERFLADASAA